MLLQMALFHSFYGWVMCLVACHVWLFATPWTLAHQAPLSVGILQARTLEWVAMPSSRGSSVYTYGPHLPYPFLCWWTFMLLPYLGYCQVLQYTLGFPLLQFFGKSFRRIVVNSSLNVWQNLPMKSSGLELLFVGRFLVPVSISVLEIEQVCFLSSWFSLRRLHLSKNLAISSRLSILLAYSCL